MTAWSVHIAEGLPLLPSLVAALEERGVRDATVRLSGALASVAVVAAPGATGFPLSGPAWLVDAHYRAHPGSVALLGTVSWTDQGLPRLAAGRLEDAVSGGVDAVVTPVGDAVEAPTVRPAGPKPTKPARRSKPKPEPKPEPRTRQAQVEAAAIDVSDALPPTPAAAPAPAASGGWSSAVKASKKPRLAGAPSPDELGFDTAPDLQAGDVLIHPRFGRCRVSRPPVSNKVKVRRPTGGIIDLHLKVLKFQRQPDEEGRRVFRVSI